MDMPCCDLRTTMRTLTGLTLLLQLLLVLFPDLGVSQSIHLAACPDCKNPISNPAFKPNVIIEKGITGYTKCAGSIVRFQLLKGSVCAKNDLDLANILQECLDKGNCQSLLLADSKKGASKGATKSPSTTIQNLPTTPLVTTPKTTPYVTNPKTTPYVTSSKTTPQRNFEVVTSTKAKEWEPTTPIESLENQDPNVDLHHGDKSSSKFKEDADSKMSNMRATIISLTFIILVMVAVGTGFYCHKKKSPLLPCFDKPVLYTPAPSVDTIEIEGSP